MKDFFHRILVFNNKVAEWKCFLIGLGLATGFSFLLFRLGASVGSERERLVVLLGGDFPLGIIQWAEYVAAFAAVLILIGRWTVVEKAAEGFTWKFLPADPETMLLPEDVDTLRRQFGGLPKDKKANPLFETLGYTMNQFRATRSVQDLSYRVKEHTDFLLQRFDSEMGFVRYLAWALPSIGFIGTVLGIGASLGQAGQAAQNIEAVTDPLNTAFDTTLVALVLSIGVMFLLHHVQRLEEQLVLRIYEYCQVNLLHRLYQPKEEK
jgi:biopolymer transport protein ExbB/TolQ